MKFKTINGLQWAMEDLVVIPDAGDDRVTMIDGVQYFDFDSANYYASQIGLRLPTRQEAVDMLVCVAGGREIDPRAFSAEKLAEPLGLRFNGGTTDGKRIHFGYLATYWTSSMSALKGYPDLRAAYFLMKSMRNVCGNGFGINDKIRYDCRIPVRCVKD